MFKHSLTTESSVMHHIVAVVRWSQRHPQESYGSSAYVFCVLQQKQIVACRLFQYNDFLLDVPMAMS